MTRTTLQQLKVLAWAVVFIACMALGGLLASEHAYGCPPSPSPSPSPTASPSPTPSPTPTPTPTLTTDPPPVTPPVTPPAPPATPAPVEPTYPG